MSAADEFKARLRRDAIKPNEIQRFLDDLSPEDRVVAIRATNRDEQRRLYAAVDGFAQVKLVDLVAPSTADLETVRHFGKNTLPLFTHFEKRFCRGPGADPDRPGELSGWNFQALKFTPDGGEVTVSASGVEGGVLVAVEDTGPGIEPEMREHLFDRFWKGHRSGGGGAGLGLAIVEGILAAHGAQVQVDTKVGEGSTFSFVLPLHREPRLKPKASHELRTTEA